MKTPTNNLHQLIASMTAAEKRYFKIHFSSSKSLVTKLFDFINTMSEYDEEIVKENFKDSKLSKNLKVYKIMLIDLLLKSLSSFRYKKNLNSSIRQSIDEVETLIEKKLYSDAYKRLARVKETCEKFEEWNSLLIILDLEFQLKVFHGFNFPAHSANDNILEAITKTSQIIKDINELRVLNYDLSRIANQLMIKKAETPKLHELEAILIKREADLDNNDLSLNFKIKYYLNSSFSHLYHCLHNLDKEYQFKKNLIDLFHAHPHFTENNPEQYWAAYYNFINCCSRAEKEQEMILSIKELKKFTDKIPEFHRKMTLIYLVEIHALYQKSDFKTIETTLEPLALEHIKTLKNSEGRGVTRTYLSLALVALATGNQTKVQFYLRRLFESGKKMDDSFSYFFEVVNFISHYESNDIEILKNLLISKKRKMKRNPKFGSPFFKEIVKLFSELIEIDADKKTAIRNFEQQFQHCETDGLFILMKHFILCNWVNALKEGNSYAEQITNNCSPEVESNNA